MSLLKIAKKILPKSVLKKLRDIKNSVGVEQMQLNSVQRISCDSTKAISAKAVSLSKIFNNQKINTSWENKKSGIEAFDIPDFTGGVNPGDRKAIFYLIRYFNPKAVLEVGTHIGASTINIATALSENYRIGLITEKPKFKTLDIRDVNCKDEKPWLDFGSSKSPSQMLNELKLDIDVDFENQSSLDYLDHTKETFDFIFLDGDHTAKTVYQEVPKALQILNSNGIILLHDYFEDGKSPWENDTRSYGGPFMAIQKLINEGADLKVTRLGELPWPTKLNTNFTSLALLTRS